MQCVSWSLPAWPFRVWEFSFGIFPPGINSLVLTDPSSKLWIIQRDAIGDDVQKDFFLHVVVNTMPKAFLLA